MNHFMHLKGTKLISSVKVFRPNFIPTLTDNFKTIRTIIIVMRYTNHDTGVKRFFKFQSFDNSNGYLDQ